ncbi:Branched-chain amino acid ABC transporter substrate-binding protein [Tenacibaculum litopenaei]|uniref:branched-chain amino acid transport system II carrier protein n=1 Tax=Tenacibaculum litopenaei TaxID=396016 RepID=UPI0038940749
MHKTKEILVTGFALFSMFFGAGNLIFPPFLGKNSGSNWELVSAGFMITAVVIPILGIYAHARLQGTMFDFAKKVSPVFSALYCYTVYAISIALPAPRTASVTHEMAIAPYATSGTLLTSSIYFSLVFIFVMNRSKVLDLLGKFLTPLIIFILLAIISIGLFAGGDTIVTSQLKSPFVYGILEGYQTFDAIGAVVVGGVLVISMNMNSKADYQAKKSLITKAGIIAGLGLLTIYIGLIYNGALYSTASANDATRAEILGSLSEVTLGHWGRTILGVLVALACFTTAVGIITGTADFIKSRFNNSDKAYLLTAIVSCLLGIVIGQYNVKYIVQIAIPALMLIYPVTIVLIVLNCLPQQLGTKTSFRWVVGTTLVFSIPDFLLAITKPTWLRTLSSYIPMSAEHLGWVLPAVLSLLLVSCYELSRKTNLESS